MSAIDKADRRRPIIQITDREVQMTMLGRRKFIAAIAAHMAVTGFTVHAQQTANLYRVGVLMPGSGDLAASEPNVQAFEARLRELGWIESKNLAIERRYAAGHTERYRELALDLVRQNVNVIVPFGGPASLRGAREATNTVPIVMVASSRDPVQDGLVKSFAHPRGNITGIVTLPQEGSGKPLEILKEAVPTLTRVGVLWDRTIAPYGVSKEIDSTSRTLGVELVPLEVRAPADFDVAMAEATKAHVQGVLVASTPMTGLYKREIADLMRTHRLPAIALFRAQAEAGLLMTYGPSIVDEFRTAAVFVDKILRGAKPEDLPVEQPTKFELVINMKTAQAIGISIPQSLLLRADEVIQ